MRAARLERSDLRFTITRRFRRTWANDRNYENTARRNTDIPDREVDLYIRRTVPYKPNRTRRSRLQI